MQTVCEGLHVNCKIANVNDFDNLTIVCSVMTLCWTLPGICFHLAVFFLKAYFTHYKHIKMHKETHVYYIYININISIYCISFFVKAVLSYKCMDAMHHGLLNRMLQNTMICTHWNERRKYNKNILVYALCVLSSRYSFICRCALKTLNNHKRKRFKFWIVKFPKTCKTQMSDFYLCDLFDISTCFSLYLLHCHSK